MRNISRRSFNKTLSKGIGGVTLIGGMPWGFAIGGEKQDKKKLGVALVGLGSYSTYQLAPSLADCELCYLAGIVTGTPEKEKIWAEKYNLPRQNIYNYENFDSIANNDDIDIIYVVLLAVLIVWRFRENIEKLLKGNERKLDNFWLSTNSLIGKTL